MTNEEFLDFHEIEIQQEANRMWTAYRFGMLFVRNAPSKAALIKYLKGYFGVQTEKQGLTVGG